MLSIITSRFARKHVLVVLIVTALAVLPASCDKVPLLAPSLSTITLSTSNSVVQSNGTAQVSATVLEQPGTAVQNGTVVTFTTTLGTVSPAEARTTNGVATTQFSANGQSGVAEIRASSGGAKPADTANPSLKLTVGAAAAGKLLMNANPSRLQSTGGSSQITATVMDTNSNPLANVPVGFSTDVGTLSSTFATTSSSGTAVITLTTTRDATVTGSVGNTTSSGTTSGTGVSGTVKVTVSIVPQIGFGATTPTAPTAGQTVSIPITVSVPTGADPLQNINVNYGDGRSQDFPNQNSNTIAQHVYTSDGVYTVTATGTTTGGDRTSASTQVSVSPRTAINVVISPNTATHGVSATFTATVTPASNIRNFTWDFGDGTPTQTTTSNSVSHVYAAAGTPTIQVTVTTTDGNTGIGLAQIVVN
jgi:PKD domain/Bacterial Ig-like domain (group 1)